ncbi:hypothetical protein [Streptomyces cinereospinus]|uniref:Peptidase n=1 Tax=Streptomyces cinereospinus TaxID=285561 RepID=A0ABV5MT95_9ACTN
MLLPTLVAPPGVARAAGSAPGASGPGAGSVGSFAFAEDARTVPAATGTADAVPLETGRTYRSTLPPGGEAYYRLALDAASNAYVSATAVPDPGAEVSAVEGVKVSVQDAEGRLCTSDTATFGAARSPHPIAAAGAREAGGTRCGGAGTYYVVVERAGRSDSAPVDWALELVAVQEPALTRAGATRTPRVWDSATPAPPADEPVRRAGGAGFASATTVGQGVWSDDIAPGQTLFYEVPVDWGRQLSATAELGAAASGAGYAVGALDVSLYNPVRGLVAHKGVGYDGTQRAAALAPLPPADHANRHSFTSRVSAMRFAGSYCLVVHLSADVAEEFGDGPFGLTLRVGLRGTAQEGPAYAGRPVPDGVFEARDGGLAGGGGAVVGGVGGAGDDGAMTAVAVAGIGGGSAILVGLGVWTVVARRRAGPAG